MATFQGTRGSEVRAAQPADGASIDALLDVVVVALIAAGFVTLAINTIARL